MKIRYILAAAACAAAFCFSSAVFADDVKTDYNHETNFSNYHTYSWGTVQVANDLDSGRLKHAVDQALQAKGWQLVPSGGQVTVTAKDQVHNEQEAETYYTGMGGGWGGRWGWRGWGWGQGGGFGEATTTVTNVPQAHLVVDMFDSQSKDIIWRGISSGELKNDPEKNRKQIYDDVDKMFKKFPPSK